MGTHGGRLAERQLASVTAVTARTRSQPVRPARKQNRGRGRTPPPARPARPAGRSSSAGPAGWAGWVAAPARLRYAVGAGLLGGLLLAIGPLLPVVSPATAPGFTAGPLLFVLGLLPVGLAVGIAATGRWSAAAGVLIATALFAPGRALADAQLAVEGSAATRPELAMPTVLQHLHGAIGLWLLLAGHALTLAAGLLAVGNGDGAEPASAQPAERRPGSLQGPVLVALGVGAVAALGLVAAPFTSDSPFLPARGALDAPTTALVGGVLIAVAAPLVATIAVTGTDAALTVGWLLGGAACVVAVAVPGLVAGLAVGALHPSVGPYLALLAALALVGLAARARRAAPAGEPVAEGAAGEPPELTLPGQRRLHRAAGALGLLAALSAAVGAAGTLFVVPADIPHPASAAGRLLWPAAAVVGVAAAGLLVPRWAPVVRPVFSVAWITVPMAGVVALDTAMTAAQLDGVVLGAGAWAAVVAMLAAAAAACCAGLAGGVEREDVDLSELTWRRPVLIPAAAAALLAVGAFGLPVLSAPGYAAPGLWSDFRFASWGLVFGLVAVIAAALLAPFSRPTRGAALLLGAAAVVALRLVELPLNLASAASPTPGPGTFPAVTCTLALLAAATAAFLAPRQPTPAP